MLTASRERGVIGGAVRSTPSIPMIEVKKPSV